MKKGGKLGDNTDLFVNIFKESHKSCLDQFNIVLSSTKEITTPELVGKIESLVNKIGIDITQREELFDNTQKQRTSKEDDNLKKIKVFLLNRLSLLQKELDLEQEEWANQILEEEGGSFDYEKTRKEIIEYLGIKPHTSFKSKNNANSKKKDNNIVESSEEIFGIKQLFKNEEQFEKVICSLVENEFIIAKMDAGYEWIFSETKEYKTIQTVIALMVVLETKNYLKLNAKAVYRYIKAEFGITMNKSTYSRSSNALKQDYEKPKTNNFRYISLFRDIL
ncbi:hypothetical protein FVB32_16095 [Flagellimonas hymeniacidonis]|uniref:Uncharacterized protein n=1 Tax=Flagellimonas hymeniacidonis TaxID=2603628 RepID=A0A5C8V4Q5_9FLAO|nr:hypothetical protein [Flagellimonas hymeniacidonis]TXN36079.1 hypothetical protein FVB32_16095 [Flagellimonas hymeniacidonis]